MFICLDQGLYVVTDMYPFHRQARKVGNVSSELLKAYKFYLAEYLGHWIPHFPFSFTFCIWILRCQSKVCFFILGCILSDTCAFVSWRWSFGIGSMYGALVLFLIVFFGRET